MKLVNPLGRKAEASISESRNVADSHRCSCVCSGDPQAYQYAFMVGYMN